MLLFAELAHPGGDVRGAGEPHQGSADEGGQGHQGGTTKVARSIALVAELDEDKTKLVADVVGMGPGKTE